MDIPIIGPIMGPIMGPIIGPIGPDLKTGSELQMSWDFIDEDQVEAGIPAWLLAP